MMQPKVPPLEVPNVLIKAQQLPVSYFKSEVPTSASYKIAVSLGEAWVVFSLQQFNLAHRDGIPTSLER
jgi:hypothetical protein